MTTKTMMKNLARSLGKKLKENGQSVPHSTLLHLIAESAGETNWHVAASKVAPQGLQAHAGLQDAAEETDASLRTALMTCVDMLQECLRHADDDSAETIDAVLINAQSALKKRSLEPSNRMILAAQEVVARWEKGDLAEAVRELDEATKQTLRQREHTSASVLTAAEDLLHAFGGWPPDWLKNEAIALENAILVERQSKQVIMAESSQTSDSLESDDSTEPDDPSDPKCQCADCMSIWKKSKLKPSTHLEERLEFPLGHPECDEPDGDCPNCGAFSYRTDRKPNLLKAAYAVVNDYDSAGCEWCGVVSQSKYDALKAAYDDRIDDPKEADLAAAVRRVLDNYDTTGCDGCGVIPELDYRSLDYAVSKLSK